MSPGLPARSAAGSKSAPFASFPRKSRERPSSPAAAKDARRLRIPLLPKLLAAAALLACTGLLPPGTVGAAPANTSDPEAKAAVAFMRTIMDQVNPSLGIEDAYCAHALPWAIYSQAQAKDLDWRQVFALAWQESAFDCHAKNRKDRGGAFGPFQIRRVWETLVGDPRYRYYDPQLAVQRVIGILNYYAGTDRHAELVKRGFRFPTLCLYQAGESQELNMEYCGRIGSKMDALRRNWVDFKRGRLVAIAN